MTKIFCGIAEKESIGHFLGGNHGTFGAHTHSEARAFTWDIDPLE